MVIVVLLIFASLCVFPGLFSWAYLTLRPLIQPHAFAGEVLFSVKVGAWPTVMVGAAYVAVAIKKKKIFFAGGRLYPILLIFGGLISYLLIETDTRSLEYVIKILTFFLVYVLTVLAFDFHQGKFNIFYAYAISTIPSCVYAVYQQLVLGQHRMSSYFEDYNEFGIYVTLSMFCTMLALINGSKGKKLVYFCLFLQLYCFLFSLNRGTWISVGIAFLLCLPIYRPRLPKSIVLLLILSSPLFGYVILERFSELHQLNKYGMSMNTFEGRVELWKHYFELSLERPFFGHGLGSMHRVVETTSLIVPHNDYARAFYELGIWGLLVYIFSVLTPIVKAVSSRKKFISREVGAVVFVASVYFVIISIAQNPMYSLYNVPIYLLLTSTGLYYAKE